jgi:hypothetical protein
MKNASWNRVAAASISLSAVVFLAILMTPTWSQTGGNGTEPMGIPTFPRNAAVAPAQVATAGTSMMASVILYNGFQQIVVVDPTKSSMAVYHIDPANGDIQLKSVRKMDADFMLEEFNLSEPTPSTIRKNVR